MGKTVPIDTKTVSIEVRLYDSHTMFLREPIADAHLENGDVVEIALNVSGEILVHVSGKPWMVIPVMQYVAVYDKAVEDLEDR